MLASRPSARRRVASAIAALAILPFAITLGLGIVWIYLSILPFAISVAIFFTGAWIHTSKSAKSARLGGLLPVWAIPFPSSLVGLLVAMSWAF